MVGDVVMLRQTRRVLLVMSNAVRAALVLTMLSSESSITDIVVADRLDEGLSNFGGSPDIVVLDVSALDKSEISFVSNIYRNFPAYVLIALDGPADRVAALNMIAAGADDYLALDGYDAAIPYTAILFVLGRKLLSKQGREGCPLLNKEIWIITVGHFLTRMAILPTRRLLLP